ncbi:hypothetical protein QOT17_004973 [Balamuthia mandrillaris]
MEKTKRVEKQEHTVIVEVLEGRNLGDNKARTYLVLEFGIQKWKSPISARTHSPVWRDYWIGRFVGTKLASPCITITVKEKHHRSHLLGTAKVYLNAVSEDKALDKWHDVAPAKGVHASDMEIRLRVTCRKSYDTKSEMEEEIKLINDLMHETKQLLENHQKLIPELKAKLAKKSFSDKEEKESNKQLLKKALREVNEATAKIPSLRARRKEIIESGTNRSISFSDSEVWQCSPHIFFRSDSQIITEGLEKEKEREKENRDKAEEENKANANANANAKATEMEQEEKVKTLQKKLNSARTKLHRELKNLEFNESLAAEMDTQFSDDEPSESKRWQQNDEELRKRVEYLKKKVKGLSDYLDILAAEQKKSNSSPSASLDTSRDG